MTKASKILNELINSSLNGDLSLDALRTIENTALQCIHQKGGKAYWEDQSKCVEESRKAKE